MKYFSDNSSFGVFGPKERYLGLFGITTAKWTLNLFPRFMLPSWGYSSSKDSDNIIWHNFDFGMLFSLTWITQE